MVTRPLLLDTSPASVTAKPKVPLLFEGEVDVAGVG
jgi:hypothetical protein